MELFSKLAVRRGGVKFCILFSDSTQNLEFTCKNLEVGGHLVGSWRQISWFLEMSSEPESYFQKLAVRTRTRPKIEIMARQFGRSLKTTQVIFLSDVKQFFFQGPERPARNLENPENHENQPKKCKNHQKLAVKRPDEQKRFFINFYAKFYVSVPKHGFREQNGSMFAPATQKNLKIWKSHPNVFQKLAVRVSDEKKYVFFSNSTQNCKCVCQNLEAQTCLVESWRKLKKKELPPASLSFSFSTILGLSFSLVFSCYSSRVSIKIRIF